MELILIRHGLPEHIVTDDGTPADPQLSETGHKQASLMADWLESQHIDRLYTSPMRRAYQTATPLGKNKNLELEVREGIAEYDRNADHYIPVEQLKEFDYDRWLRVMRGEVDHIDFPAFCDDVVATVTEIVEGNRGKTVAVVCHGGVINVWTAHVIGFEPRMFFNPNYTSISRYKAASSGERSIITLNEHTHLASLTT